ncbi:clathrin heavy chain linker domain-containing protein 1-like [Aulostomus maculatus]
MSEIQMSSGSFSRHGGRSSTPDILISESDEIFFQSLREFIEHEKQYLQCPAEGPDELRYSIYCSAFNKVISRATSYKRILLTIKGEYDDVIRALKRRRVEARMVQQSLAASSSHRTSLNTCQRRAGHLRDRICVLERETAELQEEIQRHKLSQGQRTWIPGVTMAEAEDPEALDGQLKHLQARKAALLDRKSHCVTLEAKAKLDAELQTAESRRAQMKSENNRLRVQFKRLRLVWDCLSSWEEAGQQVPLEDLLGSTLENIRRTSVTDEDARRIDAELLEHEEPTGVDESKLLADYLQRFMRLFDSAQYEEAALLAARSPRRVLRNLDIMEMFQGVRSPPGSLPPILLFLQALLIATAAGDKLSAPLSLEVVSCALQHKATQLVTHAVTQNKLTLSEELGDTLTEHAQKNPGIAEMCLALATVVYEGCGLDRKTALSMCRRGLIHNAVDFMSHSQDFTAEDCLWVLGRSLSLSLLQLLTEPRSGQAAILSAGVVCCVLLADAQQQQQLALQLLDSFVSRGREVLDDVILQDSVSSVDDWVNVASLCSGLNRADLSQAIMSVLLDQSGTSALTPDPEGARLMEHIFL